MSVFKPKLNIPILFRKLNQRFKGDVIVSRKIKLMAKGLK